MFRHRRIQEEGLRTYLFTYAPHYKTLSLSLLSRTFSLPLRTVTSIVSKMIWNEELPASLDQAAGVVVFNRVEITRPQQLAQMIAEKVGNMVEQNEKTLDFRLGGTTGWGDRGDGAKGDKRGEQTQGERRGRGERRGGSGARGKSKQFLLIRNIPLTFRYRCPWWTRWTICPGTGEPDARFPEGTMIG